MERYSAYGIRIDSEFPIPALAVRDGDDHPTLTVRRGTRARVDSFFTEGLRHCVELIEHPGGDVGLRIDHEPSVGYRMEAGAYGLHYLSSDGTIAVCAPLEVEAWRRERFLVARVLPIASLVGGREVLHASGVVVDGTAVAFLGHSGAGKTSIAARLVLDGAAALTDDLLAIALVGGEVVAYPGTRQIGIRDHEYSLLDDGELEELGNPVNREDKFYGTVELAEGPIPVGFAYILRRRREASEVSFVPEAPPDPRTLLGATFFDQLELTGDRLVRQLELFAAFARQARIFRVEVPAGVGAADLATAIRDHVGSVKVGVV